jgi:hypothetical protein
MAKSVAWLKARTASATAIDKVRETALEAKRAVGEGSETGADEVA